MRNAAAANVKRGGGQRETLHEPPLYDFARGIKRFPAGAYKSKAWASNS